MENLCNILILIFKEVSVTDILEGRVHYFYFDFDGKMFTNLAIAHYQKYSGNDAGNLYQYLRDVLNDDRDDKSVAHKRNNVNVFEILSEFNNFILKEIEGIPVCRYRYLLKWRMVSFTLDEELFTTSFLAQRDCRRQRALRKNFAWKYIIHSDNVELNNMLKRGLADNHFHLKGSAPYFYMSWINLMNMVDDDGFIRILNKYDKNRQQQFSIYHTKAAEESLTEMHLKAALIRIYLYTWLEQKPFSVLEHNFVAYDLVANVIDWEQFDNGEDIREKLIRQEKDCAKESNGKIPAAEAVWGYCLETYQLCRINGSLESSHNGSVLKKREQFSWICDQLLYSVFLDYLLSDEEKITERKLVYRCFSICPMIDQNTEFIRLFVRQDKKDETAKRAAFYEVQSLLQNQKLLLLNRDRLQERIKNQKAEGRTLHGRKPLDYIQIDPGTRDEGLYGERWFLYRMFRKLYEGDQEAGDRGNLFYAYLVMKERIRAELIQVNDRVGFDNFLRYQNRKEEFIDDTVLSKVYSRHAVISSFLGQPLKMLEARITPRMTAKGNRDYIKKIDNEIMSASEKQREKFYDGKPLEKKDYFYVFHFVKEPEREKDMNAFQCRHVKLRDKVKKQAIGIYQFRERYPKEAGRVYGIDACSPEIGCRPEVFAQAYRYLKGEQNFLNEGYYEEKRPRLRSTYHAGEDFLDIVDGMRAIDEAIYFLNMTHGDRLGHALAVGISPREWYRFKEYRVLCQKQDILDNIVWIHQKIRKYNIRDTESILMKLQRRYVHFYQEIYRSGRNRGKEDCDIDIYYDAWKLRGDNPLRYYNAVAEVKRGPLLSAWEEYELNIKYPELDKIRKEKKCIELYHRYHYDDEVKLNGRKVTEYKVEQDLISVIEKIQYHLQREILEKGIAIEANPSSNYLISTFRAYDQHPIINWYNKGLTNEKEELDRCPQLDVTINTDDQAVFGTSLENEFALMAIALEKAIDPDGRPKYKKDMIYDWLDDIRRKGFTRCFCQKNVMDDDR